MRENKNKSYKQRVSHLIRPQVLWKSFVMKVIWSFMMSTKNLLTYFVVYSAIWSLRKTSWPHIHSLNAGGTLSLQRGDKRTPFKVHISFTWTCWWEKCRKWKGQVPILSRWILKQPLCIDKSLDVLQMWPLWLLVILLSDTFRKLSSLLNMLNKTAVIICLCRGQISLSHKTF